MTLIEYVEAWPDKRPQRAWAQDFGISRAYFNLLMSGARKPSLDVIRRIHTATNGVVDGNSWLYAPIDAYVEP